MTIAIVFSVLKKSLGSESHRVFVFGPRPREPRKPRRSKKNGSERIPAKTRPPPATLVVLPVEPVATRDPFRDRLRVWVLPGPEPRAPKRATYFTSAL